MFWVPCRTEPRTVFRAVLSQKRRTLYTNSMVRHETCRIPYSVPYGPTRTVFRAYVAKNAVPLKLRLT